LQNTNGAFVQSRRPSGHSRASTPPQVKVLAEKIETAIVPSIWITLEPELLVSPWLRVWVPTTYATRRYS